MKLTTKLALVFSLPVFVLASRTPSDAPVTPPTTYSHMAVYDLEYQPDSTDQKMRTSLMALLINDQGSLFGNYGNLNYDTTVYGDHQRGGNHYSFKHLTYPRDFGIQYHIYKQKGSITTLDKIAVAESPYFRYTEDVSAFKWAIAEDTTTISGYHCQKATCTYGGRNWVAWFTMDIPVSDGPYKFSGLPGLIIQVADNHSYWKFTLTQFTSISYTYHDEVLDLWKIENSSKAAFLRLLKASYDNGFEMEQQYGVTFNNKIEEQKQFYKDRAKRENNWIEKYQSR